MFYTIFKHICHVVFKILFRIKYEGEDNIPKEGACIIASNHRSTLDPFFIFAGSKRKIIFLANRYLFDIPIIGALINKLDAIPLNKDKGDIGALKAALKTLESGGIIGIFPEGGIKQEDNAGIEEGVLFLARMTRAPIVLCSIEGSDRALPVGKYIPRMRKVTVRFLKCLESTGITKDNYDKYKKIIYMYINNIQEAEDV